ncbi:ROK family glucokinase [Pilimelia columellifera]|uniref:Glucokinase n=1 Tax=Pilimelia columellifera subsp. columellifera TaxID=706583 RepID=A0ABN3NAQ3_9ACTN
MTAAVGIDIGGTKIAAGVVDESGAILARARRETPTDDAGKLRDQLNEIFAELTDQHPVTAVGVGVAGWVGVDRATVMFAAHLPLRDIALRDQLADDFGLPVVIENDANVAAWAEHRYGAGVGRFAARSMVMLTVGTGLGGGIVLHGRLLRGAHGVAAELGHVRVVPDGRPCPCGRRGCLEQYASGRALIVAARDRAQEDPASARRLLELAGGDPRLITGLMITVAAADGDIAACGAFADVGHWLGVALADLTQVLDPNVFVIGGGVSDAGELLMAPVRDSYQAALGQRGNYPLAPVLPAGAGNDAGVIGAADLARQAG